MRTRYDQKKDQFGRRESSSDSLAMNALEQLVPKGLEDHLLLNQSRLKTFAHYDSEIKTYIEEKHTGKVKITTDFFQGRWRPEMKDLAASAKGGKGGKGFPK